MTADLLAQTAVDTSGDGERQRRTETVKVACFTRLEVERPKKGRP